jgi:hypothetical protein
MKHGPLVHHAIAHLGWFLPKNENEKKRSKKEKRKKRKKMRISGHISSTFGYWTATQYVLEVKFCIKSVFIGEKW